MSGARPLSRASRYTTTTAARAPTNARPLSSPNPRITERTGMRTAMAAPRAAPDAVPSTYGSASGLRSRPWNVTPATARPMPTSIVVRTRGRRSSMTIVSAAGVQVRGTSSPSSRWARIPSVSPGATATVPSPTPRMSAPKRSAMSTPPITTGRRRRTAARTMSGRVGARESDRTAMAYGVTGASDGNTASGWSALASASRPSTSRGPGRVTTMSSTGVMAPSLTAVRAFQPGRAATASAVIP